jgi:hypothetical protein
VRSGAETMSQETQAKTPASHADASAHPSRRRRSKTRCRACFASAAGVVQRKLCFERTVLKVVFHGGDAKLSRAEARKVDIDTIKT